MSLSEDEQVNLSISYPSQYVFTCVCGVNVFYSQMEVHVLSEQHITYVNQTRQTYDCEICLQQFHAEYMYSCETCKQHHCDSCHYKMDKCPFCRSVFPMSHLEILFVNTIEQHLFYLENTRKHHDMSLLILKDSLDVWEFMYMKPKYQQLQEKVLHVIQKHEIERILNQL